MEELSSVLFRSQHFRTSYDKASQHPVIVTGYGQESWSASARRGFDPPSGHLKTSPGHLNMGNGHLGTLSRKMWQLRHVGMHMVRHSLNPCLGGDPESLHMGLLFNYTCLVSRLILVAS